MHHCASYAPNRSIYLKTRKLSNNDSTEIVVVSNYISCNVQTFAITQEIVKKTVPILGCTAPSYSVAITTITPLSKCAERVVEILISVLELGGSEIEKRNNSISSFPSWARTELKLECHPWRVMVE